MSKNRVIIRALREVEHRLSQPGVLDGRQRSQAFTDKVLQVAEFILDRHTRPVCEVARLDEDHRLPFARRAVAGLCGVAEWSIQRIIPILESIGFFSDRSPLERWCKGNARSITPGAKPYWYRPSLFSIGAAFAVILMGGTEVAASPSENRSTPDVIPHVQRTDLNDYTSQVPSRIEENQSSPIRSTSNPSIPTGLEDDAIDNGVEASLEGFRRAVVPSAMPDDRRAPAASPGDVLAALEAKAAAGAFAITSLPSSVLGIFRRRFSSSAILDL